MALTSASSYDDTEAQYRNNADYYVAGSASKARLFAEACRHLLLLLPSTSIKGANTVSFSMSLLRDELKQAEAYARAKGTSSIVRTDFRRMRGQG